MRHHQACASVHACIERAALLIKLMAKLPLACRLRGKRHASAMLTNTLVCECVCERELARAQNFGGTLNYSLKCGRVHCACTYIITRAPPPARPHTHTHAHETTKRLACSHVITLARISPEPPAHEHTIHNSFRLLKAFHFMVDV